MTGQIHILDRMIAETKALRLKYRALGAKPKPAGNSNQIYAAALAIREQALRDVKVALSGEMLTDYPYGSEGR